MQALGAVNAAINGTREGKRIAGAGHSHVAEPALLFELFGVIKATAVREGAFFEAGQEDVVEFEALGSVQREQRDGSALIKVVGVAYQRCTVEEIGKRLATIRAFGHGIDQLIQVIDAREIFGGIALAQHVQVAGGFHNKGDELRGRQRRHLFAQLVDQLAETAQRREGARGAGIDHFAERFPKRAVAFASGGAQGVHRDLADSARRRIQDAQERDIVVWEHRKANVGENVPNFGALIKTEAAEQSIANAARAEGLFERAGLRVGAVHHGTMRCGIFALDFADALADILSFGAGVTCLEEDKVRTFATSGGEFLSDALDVFRDYSCRCVEDFLARTVILLDAENARAGKVFGKVQDVADFGAAPAIDGLIFIADDA